MDMVRFLALISPSCMEGRTARKKRFSEVRLRDCQNRKTIYDIIHNIFCRNKFETVFRKLAIRANQFIRFCVVFTGRKKHGAGIGTAGSQPEAIHEVIIRTKRWKLVRYQVKPIRIVREMELGRTSMTQTVRLVFAVVWLKRSTKRMRERRICV